MDYSFHLAFQAFFVVGFALLFMRNRPLFSLISPMYLVNICMKDWSHHARDYVVPWGVNVAYCLAFLGFAGRRTREVSSDALKRQSVS
jgi:hypothetical protein